MFGMFADLAQLSILLIGEGTQAERRLRLLDESGARHLTVLAGSPSEPLAALAGDRLQRRGPATADFAAARLVFIADCDLPTAEGHARAARATGCLVNVEDVTALCDFHVPASVRRGDLVISVSTSGRSPALARAIRNDLAARYGPEWADRLAIIAAAREDWRGQGLSLPDVAARSAALIAEKGWMP